MCRTTTVLSRPNSVAICACESHTVSPFILFRVSYVGATPLHYHKVSDKYQKTKQDTDGNVKTTTFSPAACYTFAPHNNRQELKGEM